MNGLILFSVPFVPLVFAVVLLLSKNSRWHNALPWTILPSMLAVLLIEPGNEVMIPWFLIQTSLGLTEITQIFLAFTLVLWAIASVYALDYLKHDSNKRRFFVFFALAMAGNLGLIVARDIASFYLFFALMSFAAYGLVVHEGNPPERRAGRIYLTLVVGGEVALFAALALLVGQMESPALAALANVSFSSGIMILLMIGFGIKMGAIPFHFWLPLAHAAAPTPASAVLSGAMIKAGLLGWLQFLPLGMEIMTGWGWLLVTIGILSAFYGVTMGVGQSHPKAVLAYSSVSQMGVITVLLGIALVVPQYWPMILIAVLVYAVHHALVKAALFLGVGVVSDQRSRSWVIIGLVIAALSLAGAPLTSGLTAKLTLKQALADYPYLVTLLTMASIGTAVLMVRFIYTVLNQTTRSHGAGLRRFFAWLILLVIVLLYPWFWMLSNTSILKSFEMSVIYEAFWPIGIGLVIAYLSYWLINIRKTGSWQVAEGDVVVVFERGIVWTGKIFARFVKRVTNHKAHFLEIYALSLNKLKAYDTSLVEEGLGKWMLAGICYLSLLLILLLLFGYF